MLIDISPPLFAATPVFPGDTPFSASRTWSIGAGVPVNVSKFEMTTHAGAHADAPLHYDANGAAIDEVALEPYIGPCLLIHLIGARPAVTPAMLEAAMGGADNPPRILIRTHERQPLHWDADYAAVSAAAIGWLAARGARLIGVDTPSLDPADSKTMDAHRAVFAADMRVLENLVLDDVPAGRYELIAPPLKLQGLDAAPVRAVLRTF